MVLLVRDGPVPGLKVGSGVCERGQVERVTQMFLCLKIGNKDCSSPFQLEVPSNISNKLGLILEEKYCLSGETLEELLEKPGSTTEQRTAPETKALRSGWEESLLSRSPQSGNFLTFYR